MCCYSTEKGLFKRMKIFAFGLLIPTAMIGENYLTAAHITTTPAVVSAVAQASGFSSDLSNENLRFFNDCFERDQPFNPAKLSPDNRADAVEQSLKVIRETCLHAILYYTHYTDPNPVNASQNKHIEQKFFFYLSLDNPLKTLGKHKEPRYVNAPYGPERLFTNILGWYLTNYCQLGALDSQFVPSANLGKFIDSMFDLAEAHPDKKKFDELKTLMHTLLAQLTSTSGEKTADFVKAQINDLIHTAQAVRSLKPASTLLHSLADLIDKAAH